MAEFTKLEQAVLTSICGAEGAIGEALQKLLLTALVVERDNTGHGFYTTFVVDQSQPAIELPERLIGGPTADVQVGNDVLMMQFLLWFEHGYPKCLKVPKFGQKRAKRLIYIEKI